MRAVLTVATISLLLYGSVAKAQLKGFGIGPYIERVWPAGSSANTLKNGLGAGLSADIKLPAKLGLTGSIGYLHFGGRSVNTENGTVKSPAVNAFPLRAGLKFRPVPFIYFKMEAGSANFTGDGGTAFLLSPGVGIRVLGIDLQGKYERWYDAAGTRFWGLRAGLNL